MRLYLERSLDTESAVVDVWLDDEATGYPRWAGMLSHRHLAEDGIDLKHGQRVEIKIEIVETK